MIENCKWNPVNDKKHPNSDGERSAFRSRFYTITVVIPNGTVPLSPFYFRYFNRRFHSFRFSSFFPTFSFWHLIFFFCHYGQKKYVLKKCRKCNDLSFIFFLNKNILFAKKYLFDTLFWNEMEERSTTPSRTFYPK